MIAAPRPAVRMVDIDENHAGQRIDNFLLGYLKGVPRSYIYRILRTGQVRVNKSRAKPTQRLHVGDQVRIPPVSTPGEAGRVPSIPGHIIKKIEKSIIYEDNGILVINKPSGLPVHAGSGLSYGVIEGLRLARPEAPFMELVHRLDRETSGCLLIAKQRETLVKFHQMLRHGQVEKTYLALLQGSWQGGVRTVQAALRKNVLSAGERLVKVQKAGKEAETVFEPVASFPGATLVQANPLTGRTHQIRVHAAHINHPIAGDDKYGNEAFNKYMRQFGLKRLFLHAAALSFARPDTGKRLHVQAPLEASLQEVLDRLEQRGDRNG